MSAIAKDAISGSASALVPFAKGQKRTLTGDIAGTWPLRPRGEATPRRRRGDRDEPFVVDVTGGKQPRQTLKVRPAVFIGLIDRLDHPLIAHSRRPLGGHLYTVQCGAFVVQTKSPEKLSFLDSFEHRMEDVSPVAKDEKQENAMASTSEKVKVDTDVGVVRRTEPLMELETSDGFYITEWWNTPEDPALSVARMRIESGVSTQPYQLHGITERYLFLSGNGFVEIDGVVHRVGPGDGMLIKPGPGVR